jgi:hypothetical protein
MEPEVRTHSVKGPRDFNSLRSNPVNHASDDSSIQPLITEKWLIGVGVGLAKHAVGVKKASPVPED